MYNKRHLMRNSLPILKLQTNDMVLNVDNQGIRQIVVIVSPIVPVPDIQ